jgi:hypothetical protein
MTMRERERKWLRAPRGIIVRSITVPDSIARGDFLIAVEAVRGDERARMLVPLRVMP